MTALNPSPAALLPSQARSQLATGAYPGARRLSFQIVGGKPNPAGNSAAAPINGFLPRGSARFVTRSSKQQPTQYLCDCSSEQDEIFLVGPVLLGRHPSFPTPFFDPSLFDAPCVSQTHSASDGGRSDGTVVRRTRNLVQQYGG